MYAFIPEKTPSLVERNFCLAIQQVFASASTIVNTTKGPHFGALLSSTIPVTGYSRVFFDFHPFACRLLTRVHPETPDEN
jgi:hypothetical protein